MLPPEETDAALDALGWRSDVVFAIVLTTQATVLVATVVSAGLVLATAGTSAYAAALVVVLVLFAGTATQAASGWRTAVPGSASGLDIAQSAAPLAFLSLIALFPTGRAVPRWVAAIPALWLGLGFFSLVVPWWEHGGMWIVAPSALAFALVIAMIVAQTIRYRRYSDRTARQQTKWVMLAFGPYLAFLLPVFVLPPGTLDRMSGPGGVAFSLVHGTVSSVLFGFIPVSIALAIAKYRLFAVDLVIRRTLVWGLLVVSIAVLYGALVCAAALVWQGSDSVAAGVAAVVVALVAHPLRMWLQRRATHWVYGERGDPYQVVSRLGDELRRQRTVPRICARVAEVLVDDLLAEVLVDDLRYSGAELRVGDESGAPRLAVGVAPGPLPPAVEVAAYRIAVEAITNAVRHAGATRIDASFLIEEGALVVTVDDDGVGLQGSRPGTGRRSMQERADDLDGRIRVGERPGGGTRVLAILPVRTSGEREDV